jgi:hypothetical protein
MRPTDAGRGLTSSSTSARLLAESAKMPSVDAAVSQISFLVKSLKRASSRSITNASSLRIMQAALSSVNCGLNATPAWRRTPSSA